MTIATLIRRMAEAGAPPEAIAIAVEAIEAAGAKDAERRAKQAERKRRSRDSHGTVTGQGVTVTSPSCDPPAPNDAPALSSTVENNLNPTPLYSPRPQKKCLQKPTYDPDFEDLWHEFPRVPNSSKSEAYAVWLRLEQSDREQAFLGAGKVTEWAKTGKDPPFIPHLVTWLRQRRFDSFAEAAE